MNEISIWSIIHVIVQRIWILIIAGIIAAAGTYVYCENFVDPVYKAQSAVIASNGGITSDIADSKVSTTSKIVGSDISSSLGIMDTYVDIMKTYNFYERLANEPSVKRFGFSAIELSRMINVSKRSDYTLFIDVNVYCSDSKTAIMIANFVSQIAPEYIQTMLPNAYIVQSDKCVSASLVAPMSVRNSVIAACLVILLLIAIFVVLSIMDTTIKGEEDITKRYNVAVLGAVPDFELKVKKGARQ